MDLLFLTTVFLFCLTQSLQISIKSDDHYIAAVVEFKADSNNTWKDYFNIISDASEQEVDIIVFPEGHSSTTKTVKVPIGGILKENPVPSLRPDLYDEVLVLMSEAAKKYSIYVVINLHEELDCTVDSSDEICPESEIYIFNTNVVFDRTGAVIARYRKYNLYGERNVTASFEPLVTIIETDFGVKFGIVICYDIFNRDPFMQLINKDIKNIIVSTNWVSELPFITAVQSFESLAYGLDVNLLVSGYNNVTDHASGSGIFSGKSGTLISFTTGVPTTKLLVAKVPKTPKDGYKGSGPVKQNPAYFDGLSIHKDLSLPSHVSKIISPGNQTVSLVFNDMTCKFNITMRNRNGEKHYKYRAGAFNGVRATNGAGNIGVRDCAVFICTDNNIDSCGERFIPYVDNATAIFEELSIEATVPTPKRSLTGIVDGTFYPTSLDVYLLPLEPNEFIYTVESNDTVSTHKLTLNNKDAQLYTFGFWGRMFDKDGGKTTPVFEDQEEDVGKIIEKEMQKVLKHLGDKREKQEEWISLV